MQRRGHHRADFRGGPFHAFHRRKAAVLRRLIDPGRVLERFVGVARRVGPDTYEIKDGAALFLKARTVLDDWRPLAEDTEGTVWE